MREPYTLRGSLAYQRCSQPVHTSNNESRATYEGERQEECCQSYVRNTQMNQPKQLSAYRRPLHQSSSSAYITKRRVQHRAARLAVVTLLGVSARVASLGTVSVLQLHRALIAAHATALSAGLQCRY